MVVLVQMQNILLVNYNVLKDKSRDPVSAFALGNLAQRVHGQMILNF